MRRARFRALAILTVVALAGCAPSPAPSAVSTIEPTNTPTPTPTVDLSVMPENRFGIDCSALVDPSELAPLFGAALPFAPSREFGRIAWESLTQDRALHCRWGERPALDDTLKTIIVTATPGDPSELASLVADIVPDSYVVVPTEIPGVGDMAWATCQYYDDTAICFWVVAVGEIWLTVELDRLVIGEVATEKIDEYSTAATPLADSATSRLVDRIANQIAAATLAPVPSVSPAIAPCDTLVDWESIASQLDLPYQGPSPRSDPPADLKSTVLERVANEAAQHQSVRSCIVEFGEWSADARPTLVRVLVVPNGTWLSRNDQWSGWDGDDCHAWEGGPVCEFAALSGTTAVYVMASGGTREGVGAKVVAALTP